jgi:hypothetical protein
MEMEVNCSVNNGHDVKSFIVKRPTDGKGEKKSTFSSMLPRSTPNDKDPTSEDSQKKPGMLARARQFLPKFGKKPDAAVVQGQVSPVQGQVSPMYYQPYDADDYGDGDKHEKGGAATGDSPLTDSAIGRIPASDDGGSAPSSSGGNGGRGNPSDELHGGARTKGRRTNKNKSRSRKHKKTSVRRKKRIGTFKRRRRKTKKNIRTRRHTR